MFKIYMYVIFVYAEEKGYVYMWCCVLVIDGRINIVETL
jgi:hypothetical protein